MNHCYAYDKEQDRWRPVSLDYPYPFIEEKEPTNDTQDSRLGLQNLEQSKRNTDVVKITLRDYQQASVDKLFEYFTKKDGNPIVALPTGTGKSYVIGGFLKKALTQYPGTQAMLLTHRKELIEQDFKALLDMWPTAPAGIYSAGLDRRDHKDDVVFAGINSVYTKPEKFGMVHLILIDECHLVSPKGSTMYRTFINKLREVNPKLKVIGFSATPYRLGQGMLTDTDQGIFTDIAFDLTDRNSFNWLIEQGWIAPLIPKQTVAALDVSKVRMSRGDFVLKDLQIQVDEAKVTIAALKETVAQAHNRKHWLIFATGIAHAEHIADFLNDHFHIPAAAVHSKMKDEDRDQVIRDFKAGRLRAVVNNNILTTGFDFPDIDCIVMLRPTASPVLWVQMLGRGTRPAKGKDNCLVLDFAGNTKRLGPINDPVLPKQKGKGAPGVPPVRLCEKCGAYSHASARVCENPECQEPFPKNVKFTSMASIQELIAGTTPTPNKLNVTKVTYAIHKKEGKPDSMRVTYFCGLRMFREYVCLDHGGYATHIAHKWWMARSPWGVPPDTHTGMSAVKELKVPSAISVIEKGKYPEIVGYEFDD